MKSTYGQELPPKNQRNDPEMLGFDCLDSGHTRRLSGYATVN